MNQQYIEILHNYEAPCVSTISMGHKPIVLKHGHGMVIEDADGKKYLDFVAGFGTLSCGHANPRILRAIKEQGELLLQGMGDVHPSQVRAELCEKLISVAPAGLTKAAILTTGSDAVEMALKLASAATGKSGVLSFTGAYHGQTIGALSVTDEQVLRKKFKDYIFEGVVFAPYPDPFLFKNDSCNDMISIVLEKTDRLLSKRIAGKFNIGSVIVEPIQGKNGNIVSPSGFLKGVRDLCDKYGALLIVDEILTGFGRTGKWFCVEHENVTPDLMTVGKGLGGGLPIGAVLGKTEVMDAWRPSTPDECHSSTFMGHPLSCAAALAVIEEFTAWKLVERSRDLGEFFMEQLQSVMEQYKRIHARGKGLMIGIECFENDCVTTSPSLASYLVEEGRKAGFILLNGGSRGQTLTLWPPLIISHTDIMRFIEFLYNTLAKHTAL